MLWRSGRRLLTTCRPYSTSTEAYANFRKLRAYPFAFSKETAISYFGIFAAGLCKKELFSSAIGRFLPDIVQPIQPKRIVPLYFPAWIIDAEIEATATHGNVGKRFVAQIQDGYLPGSSFQVLSSVPLWSSTFDAVNETRPWSRDLTHQFSQDISCLPFTIYPFTGLKALSTWAPQILPKTYCSFDTIKPTLAVFRPILIPVYLAQYESTEPNKSEPRLCTLFMDASSSSSTVRACRPPTSFTDEYDTGFNDLSKAMGFLTSSESDIFCFGSEDEFVNISSVSISPFKDIIKVLTRSIKSEMRDPETLQALAEVSVIEPSDSDPRIREYDPEDRAAVEKWMEVGSELMMVRRIIERINDQLETISGEGSRDHMRVPIQSLETNEMELKKMKDELEPQWWREYVEQKNQEKLQG